MLSRPYTINAYEILVTTAASEDVIIINARTAAMAGDRKTHSVEVSFIMESNEVVSEASGSAQLNHSQ